MSFDEIPTIHVNRTDVEAHIIMHLAGLSLDCCVIYHPRDYNGPEVKGKFEWMLSKADFEKCRIKTFYNTDYDRLELVDPDIKVKFSKPERWKIQGIFNENGLDLTEHGKSLCDPNFLTGVQMLLEWRHPDYGLITEKGVRPKTLAV